MAQSFFGILKSLLIQDSTDRTKQLSIEVSPSATTGTKTTIVASQTANRTITLPDNNLDLNNITNANISPTAAIDATKIADGSISNTEFQRLNGVSSDIQTQLNTNATAISDHISDATDAHTASAITNVPSGNLVATNVQNALNELQTEIDGIVSGGGANNSLSNLTNPTAINQDLLPSPTATRALGSLSALWTNLYSQAVSSQTVQFGGPSFLGRLINTTTPSGASAVVLENNSTSGSTGIVTSSASFAGTLGSVYVETGDNSSGNSGSIQIRTGTATGTRGAIRLRNGSEGTVGHVWTSTGTNGEGSWQGANYQVSASSGAFSTNSTILVDVTNLSVSITTTGRPVILKLVGTADNSSSWLRVSSTAASPGFAVMLVRDSTDLNILYPEATFADGGTNAIQLPPSCIEYFDVPAAGTYTYKIQAGCIAGSTGCQINNVRLVAYEI